MREICTSGSVWGPGGVIPRPTNPFPPARPLGTTGLVKRLEHPSHPTTSYPLPPSIGSNRQPATGNRQPGTENREPATGNRQPGTENREPRTGIG
jgi:hypothetical protein